jgi:peptidoglycan/LPS O-acetylase OafA/YrhL
MRRDRYPLIDGLRAAAALGVLLTHSAISSGLVTAGGTGFRYAQRLEVGVTIFFVISGFVLYRPFLVARLEAAELPRVGRYARRRALRIVPAYWIALTVSALVLARWSVFTPKGLLAYYGFGQIYSQSTLTGGLIQAWTLDVEVTFYVFIPVWAWLLRRASLRQEAYALVGLALASLAWKAAFVWSGSPSDVHDTAWLHSLPAYLDQFALGMGLAVASVSARGVRVRRPVLLWALALLAFWAVSVEIGIGRALFEPYDRWQYMARHALYAVIGVSLVTAAVAATPRRGVVGRVLGHPVALWLGVVSYGIYLWHVTVLQALEDVGFQRSLHFHPFIVVTLVTVAATCLLAAASWYGAERPILRAGSRPWRRPRDHAAGQQDRHEADRGHLPVPVHAGVEGPRGEGGAGDRRLGPDPRPHAAEERA